MRQRHSFRMEPTDREQLAEIAAWCNTCSGPHHEETHEATLNVRAFLKEQIEYMLIPVEIPKKGNRRPFVPPERWWTNNSRSIGTSGID